MASKKKDRAFSELSKEEQLSRAKAAHAKASATLKGPTRSNNKTERAGAFKAQKAAERVISRLGGKAPSRDAATKPSPGGLMEGVRGLMDLAKTAVRLPGKMKENLNEVEKKSRKSGK